MQAEISFWIKSFVSRYPSEATGWNTPLVAFADAADPMFGELKKWVGPGHAMPEDLLPGARSVLCFFLPFEKRIAQSNAGDGASSIEWARAYIETNRMIADLNNGLAEYLADKGVRAARLPATHNFDETALISDWSHKHVAYIAGLGRFGAHQMLITDKGCAGRLGSMVLDLQVTPTVRPAEEFCLHLVTGRCLACVKKCPNRALTVHGFDRHRCYENCLANADTYRHLGLADVCGKCAAVTPCSFVNPVRQREERRQGATRV